MTSGPNNNQIHQVRHIWFAVPTGYVSLGFPVLSAYIVLNTSMASLFLPRDIRNLGLSPKRLSRIEANRLGVALARRNTLHDGIDSNPSKRYMCIGSGMITQAAPENDLCYAAHRHTHWHDRCEPERNIPEREPNIPVQSRFLARYLLAWHSAMKAISMA